MYIYIYIYNYILIYIYGQPVRLERHVCDTHIVRCIIYVGLMTYHEYVYIMNTYICTRIMNTCTCVCVAHILYVMYRM